MVASPPIRIPPRLKVTDEQFLQIVRANSNLRMERTATGELIIMAPTGSEGGNYNAEATSDFVLWNRQVRLGKVFDSSSGFRLPNGATRSPDTAWVAQARWDALTPEQRRSFAPLCPDFVLELASETDDLDDLKAKMQEYMDNGCRLGWLIEPKTRQVYIYRPGQSAEVLRSPATLAGEAVLPDFVLDLQAIFSEASS